MNRRIPMGWIQGFLTTANSGIGAWENGGGAPYHFGHPVTLARFMCHQPGCRFQLRENIGEDECKQLYGPLEILSPIANGIVSIQLKKIPPSAGWAQPPHSRSLSPRVTNLLGASRP